MTNDDLEAFEDQFTEYIETQFKEFPDLDARLERFLRHASDRLMEILDEIQSENLTPEELAVLRGEVKNEDRKLDSE